MTAVAKAKPKLVAAPSRSAPVWGPAEIIDDFEQGSPEWTEVRLGIPTASNFAMVLRDGDSVTRTEYLYKLAGERLTGRPAEGKIKTAAMIRGNEMEEEAREDYSRSRLSPIRRVAFVRRRLPSGRYCGASPDGLIDPSGKASPRGALEIKTMAPHLMIDRLVKGSGMPSDHRAQVYGTMLVCEVDFVEFTLFYSGMPVSPKFTVHRDEKYLRELSDAIEVFDHELDRLVSKIKSMGRARS